MAAPDGVISHPQHIPISKANSKYREMPSSMVMFEFRGEVYSKL
jgi:hypothetical protein